jgi:hypothetical protein
MAALYCFKDRKLELFQEACTRGFLAAILDFPYPKSQEECIAASQRVPDELRAQVCCVDGDEEGYRTLIISAWCSLYRAHGEHASERESVVEASVLRKMAPDEALRFIRNSFSDDGSRQSIAQAYGRFVEAALHREHR